MSMQVVPSHTRCEAMRRQLGRDDAKHRAPRRARRSRRAARLPSANVPRCCRSSSEVVLPIGPRDDLRLYWRYSPIFFESAVQVTDVPECDRTTVSPSSSSTSRRTPCVAGCCGPMLISMCSPSRSGSSAGGDCHRDLISGFVDVTSGVPHRVALRSQSGGREGDVDRCAWHSWDSRSYAAALLSRSARHARRRCWRIASGRSSEASAIDELFHIDAAGLRMALRAPGGAAPTG